MADEKDYGLCGTSVMYHSARTFTIRHNLKRITTAYTQEQFLAHRLFVQLDGSEVVEQLTD